MSVAIDIAKVYKKCTRKEIFGYSSQDSQLETRITVDYDTHSPYAFTWSVNHYGEKGKPIISTIYFINEMWPDGTLNINLKLSLGALLRQAWMLWVAQVEATTDQHYLSHPFTDEICMANIKLIQMEDLL